LFTEFDWTCNCQQPNIWEVFSLDILCYPNYIINYYMVGCIFSCSNCIIFIIYFYRIFIINKTSDYCSYKNDPGIVIMVLSKTTLSSNTRPYKSVKSESETAVSPGLAKARTLRGVCWDVSRCGRELLECERKPGWSGCKDTCVCISVCVCVCLPVCIE